MPNRLQNMIAYLQVLNTPRTRKRKLIYERILGTDREILIRSISLDDRSEKMAHLGGTSCMITLYP